MSDVVATRLPGPVNDTPAAVGLGDIFAMIRRHWFAAGLIVGVVLALGVLATAAMIPKYEAQALVMVRGERIESLQVRIDQLRGEPGFPTVLSEAEILSSPGLLDSVVERLDLTSDPEFNPRLEDDFELPPIRAAFADGRERLLALLGLTPEPRARNPELERRIVLARLQGAVAVEPRGRSYVVEVGAVSRSAAAAARLANGISEAYVAAERAERVERLAELDTWLDQRLVQLRSDVVERAEAVEAFRQSEDLFEGQSGSLQLEELSGLSDRLVDAQADTARAEAQLSEVQRAAEAGSATEALSLAVDAPLIQRLRADEIELGSRLVRLSSTRGPQHPEVVSARRELTELRGRIGGEIQKIVTLAEARLGNARAREQSIAQARQTLKNSIDEKREAYIRLTELERDAESARTALDSFQTQANQLVGAGEIEQPTAMMISPAKAPLSPSQPNRKALFALSLAAGLMLAGLYVVLREVTEQRVKSGAELRRLSGLRLLAVLPRVRGLRVRSPAARRRLERRPDPAFAQAMRRLYAGIRHGDNSANLRCVMVCSGESGEGKTLTAIGLAQEAAAIGRRTLLIDLDLHKRDASRAYPADDPEGREDPDLAAAMELPERLDQLTWRGAAGRLRVLRPRSDAVDPLAYLEHPRLDVLLREARRRFDLVIVDTPPLLTLPDTSLLVRRVDACLLLVRWNRTKRSALRQSLDLLAAFQAPLLGCVFTQVDLKRYGAYQSTEDGYLSPASVYVPAERKQLVAPS